MDSPLGPVLNEISMIQSKMSLLILLVPELSFWKQYVNDTIIFIKIGTVDRILAMLNKLHPNIQFKYETVYNLKLTFLDVMIYVGTEKTLLPKSIENKLMPMFISIRTLKTLTQHT